MSTATTKSAKAAKANPSQENTTMSETALSTATPAFAAMVQEIVIKTPDDQTGVTVNLPNRFASKVGQPMSEDDAKMIFAHTAGQFRNNQTANAKAREARYAKEGKAEDAPWTAAQYLDKWADYSPNIGGADRQSQTEKLRYEAAKRVWVALVAEHNASIENGGPQILKSAAKVGIAARPVKTKAVSTEAHEAAVAEWQDKQTALYDRLLAAPAYADRINAMLETLTAEAGKAKAEATAQEASADLI